MTLTVGLLVGVVSFAVNRWSGDKIDPLLFSSLISIIYLFIPAFILGKLILPTEYSIAGAQPIHFFTPTFFGDELESENRLIRIYLNEIYNYPLKIESNKTKNETRWRIYIKAFIWIAISPLAFLLIFLATAVIASFLSCHYDHYYCL